MSFSFIPIASGSAGNCTLIETEKTKVLVDCGISYTKLLKRLSEFNISIDTIDRIYITHAHTDHTVGLITFLKKTKVPVFTRRDTLTVLKQKFSKDSLILDQVNLIINKYCQVKDLKVKYFKLPHDGWNIRCSQDAGEHIGFIFENRNHRLSYMTDCGHLTEGVKALTKSSDAYIIESNYDHSMQMNSTRPWGLKNRVMGDKGHLSNDQTSGYLLELTDVNKTKHIFLAHLSGQCNTEELAISTVRKKLKDKFIDTSQLSVRTDLLKRYQID